MGSGTDGACEFCGSQRHYTRDHAKHVLRVYDCTHVDGHIFENGRERCTWCGLYWLCIEKGHAFMGKPSLCARCKIPREEKPMGHPMDAEIDERLRKQSQEKQPEKVDHPQHYGGEDNPYEAIKVIEAWFAETNLSPIVAALLFNVIKYLSRAGKKPGETLLDDLRKTRWYLDRAIAHVERQKAQVE